MNRPRKSPKPKGEDNPELTNGKKEDTSENEKSNLFSEQRFEELNLDDGDFTTEEDTELDNDFDTDKTGFNDDDFNDTDIDDDVFIYTTTIEIEDDVIQEDPKEEDEVFDEGVNYEYDLERSYFFIFGPTTAGKTVIISSLIRCLEDYRGANGDTLILQNNDETPHEMRGQILYNKLTEAQIEDKFPLPTEKAASTKDKIPTHLNFEFFPANEGNGFKFCLMDMAGEDLMKIDPSKKEQLPASIKTYIQDVEKNNLCFIYVLNPEDSDTLTKSYKVTLFRTFINLLDQNHHTGTPILFLVSKWDTVKQNYSDVQSFLEEEYPRIWGVLNQERRSVSYAEFSIGTVDSNNSKIIKKYDYSYAERVFKWMYNVQVGGGIDSDNKKHQTNKDKLKTLFRWRR
jgi:hypothetical protein